jgi:hypothetical protein
MFGTLKLRLASGHTLELVLVADRTIALDGGARTMPPASGTAGCPRMMAVLLAALR